MSNPLLSVKNTLAQNMDIAAADNCADADEVADIEKFLDANTPSQRAEIDQAKSYFLSADQDRRTATKSMLTIKECFDRDVAVHCPAERNDNLRKSYEAAKARLDNASAKENGAIALLNKLDVTHLPGYEK